MIATYVLYSNISTDRTYSCLESTLIALIRKKRGSGSIQLSVFRITYKCISGDCITLIQRGNFLLFHFAK